jgi:methionine sulfoxide reductase heme-binding subunit
MSAWSTSGAAWFLMRSSGVVVLVLLTATMALGIGTNRRWRASGTQRFVTLALHRNLSLLAVVFLSVHVVTALVDPYAGVGLAAVFVPLLAVKQPLYVALGTISLDLIAALIVSSLLRRHLSLRSWRAIHWLAYLSWPLAFWHGVGMGTDSGAAWMRVLAGGCAAVIAVSIVVRVAGREPTAKHLEPHTSQLQA